MNNHFNCFKPLKNRIIILVQLVILALFVPRLLAGNATTIITLLLLFCVLDVLLFSRESVIKKGDAKAEIAFFVLAGITILSVSPELNDYLSLGLKGEAGILRIENLAQTIKGIAAFPVKLDSVGSPDLFLIVPALLRLAGFNIIASYKAYVIALAAFTTFITYKSAVWCGLESKNAIFLTICYVFCPYRLYALYYLCDIGEYTALAFIPMIAAGIVRLLSSDTSKEGYRNSKYLLIIGMTGVLASKPLFAGILSLLGLITFVVFFRRTFRKKTIREIAISVGFIVGINAFYILSGVKSFFTAGVRLPIQDILAEAKGLHSRGRFFVLWWVVLLCVAFLLRKKKYTVVVTSALIIMAGEHFLETALYERTAVWWYDFGILATDTNTYLPIKTGLLYAFCAVSLVSTIGFAVFAIIERRKCRLIKQPEFASEQSES